MPKQNKPIYRSPWFTRSKDSGFYSAYHNWWTWRVCAAGINRLFRLYDGRQPQTVPTKVRFLVYNKRTKHSVDFYLSQDTFWRGKWALIEIRGVNRAVLGDFWHNRVIHIEVEYI